MTAPCVFGHRSTLRFLAASHGDGWHTL
jgi:hypothetical protein